MLEFHSQSFKIEFVHNINGRGGVTELFDVDDGGEGGPTVGALEGQLALAKLLQ